MPPDNIGIFLDLNDRVNHPGDVTFFVPTLVALAHENRLSGFQDRYGILELFVDAAKLIPVSSSDLFVTRSLKKTKVVDGKNRRYLNFGNSIDNSIARWIFGHFQLSMSFEEAVCLARNHFNHHSAVPAFEVTGLLGVPSEFILVGLEVYSGRRLGSFGAVPSKKTQEEWWEFAMLKIEESGLTPVIVGTEKRDFPNFKTVEYVDLRGKTSLQQLISLIAHTGCEMVVCRDNLISHLCGLVNRSKLFMMPRSFLTRFEYDWIERRFFNVFD